VTPRTTCVVICAYTFERWDDLVAAVQSALGQSRRPDEVLMVIDHNENLLHRSQQQFAADSRVRVLPNAGRQGLSGARNTAVHESSADVVVFLDDDATAQPGWLEALVEPYDDPRVVAVGGAAQPQFPAERSRPAMLPCAASETFQDPRGELDWVVGCTYTGQPEVLADVRNVMGCNMSFRRDVFDLVGGFSEDLGRVGTTPLGCEETEICIRVALAQPTARILFEPKAVVRHRVTEQRLLWRYLRSRSYAEGLSKAAVARMTERGAALSTERSYVASVLPRAVLRELGAAVTRRRRGRSGVLGAAAIVIALSATVVGYGWGTVALAWRARGQLGSSTERTALESAGHDQRRQSSEAASVDFSQR